jgi:hypothetical protein
MGDRAQRASEDQPVKTGKRPRDLVLVFRDKLMHGVSASPRINGRGKPISYEIGNAIIVWLRLCRAVERERLAIRCETRHALDVTYIGNA